jgi:hypothetical protein
MEGMDTPSNVTPETSSADTGSDSQEFEGTESQDFATGSKKVANQVPKGSQKKDAPAQDDEFEEIALGSVKAKLPKSVAKAVKDLERGFHMKAQDLAKAKRELDTLEKGDLREIFKRRGIDAEEWAESTLAEKLELLSMSPEQRELKELREERARQDAAKKEIEEREKMTREAQEIAKHEETLSQEIAQAFQKTGLPPSKLYFEQITAAMYRAAQKGEDLSAEEAASRIGSRFQSQLAEHIQSLGAQGLRQLIGDKIWGEMREQDLKRVQDASSPHSLNAGQPSPGVKPANKAQNGKRKSMSPAEWSKWVDSL